MYINHIFHVRSYCISIPFYNYPFYLTLKKDIGNTNKDYLNLTNTYLLCICMHICYNYIVIIYNLLSNKIRKRNKQSIRVLL